MFTKPIALHQTSAAATTPLLAATTAASPLVGGQAAAAEQLKGHVSRLRLHYDAVFDPDACFHLEIQWLAAPSWKVRDWVFSFLRRTRAAGLHPLMIPCREEMQLSDCFQTHLQVPCRHRRLRVMAQEFLLHKLGFVLDSYRQDVDPAMRLQYMHSSGVAVVRVWARGFVWIESGLYKPQGLKRFAAQLFRRFRDFCAMLRQINSTLTKVLERVFSQAHATLTIPSA